MAEVNFPTEVVDLPSQGLLYPKDSPLSSGKIEVKYRGGGTENGVAKNARRFESTIRMYYCRAAEIF